MRNLRRTCLAQRDFRTKRTLCCNTGRILLKNSKTGRSCFSAKMPGTANVRLNCGPEVLRAISSAKPWIWPTPSRKLTTRLVRRENFPFCLKNRVFQQNRLIRDISCTEHQRQLLDGNSCQNMRATNLPGGASHSVKKHPASALLTPEMLIPAPMRYRRNTDAVQTVVFP